MGLGSALNAVLSGMRATQSGVELSARNIANADTPGYTRKSIEPIMRVSAGKVMGVDAGNVRRSYDSILSKALRIESGAASYTSTQADYLSRLEQAFQPIGSPQALDTSYNNFVNALQALATTPESELARNDVISNAQFLSNRLNSLSDDVQGLREEIEQSIDQKVDRANELLEQIENINTSIQRDTAGGLNPVDSMDLRDQTVLELSKLIPIEINNGALNSISIKTKSGVNLFSDVRSEIRFSPAAGVGPQSTVEDGSLGSIVVGSGSTTVSLMNDNALSSGELGALISLRDETLPQVQNQLDALASNLAKGLSNINISGTPATSGAQTGFSVDIANLQPGDTLSLTTTVAGQQQTITLKAASDSSAFPLSDDGSVIGIDLSAGTAAIASALDTSLGASINVSGSGTTLTFLDDGATANSDVDALSMTYTNTSLSNGQTGFPLFTDGTQIFSGDPSTSQTDGFSGRIKVNANVISDTSTLVNYISGVDAQSDATRPLDLINRLTNTDMTFTPTAVGNQPVQNFTGSISDYTLRIVSDVSTRAETSARIDEGQQAILSNIETRNAEETGVNVDEEMANLIKLQNAYAANARVISIVDEMYDALLRI